MLHKPYRTGNIRRASEDDLQAMLLDPEVSILAANILLARSERQITIESLMLESGVSRGALDYLWRAGASPRLTTILPIADVLEVSLDELCGRDASAYRPMAVYKRRSPS